MYQFDTETINYAAASREGDSQGLAPHTEVAPRAILEELTTTFRDTLPIAMKPMARQAATAAIRATRTADAVRAARAVVVRVPMVAKAAIREAVLARNATRDERARVRALAVQDRYTVPLPLRLPALRAQHDREHYAWVWRWIEATCEQELAEEKAAAEKAAAEKG